ncbi:MAG: hypothetical protein RLZZ272_1213, partial [Actinomycetota bacterium]
MSAARRGAPAPSGGALRRPLRGEVPRLVAEGLGTGLLV